MQSYKVLLFLFLARAAPSTPQYHHNQQQQQQQWRWRGYHQQQQQHFPPYAYDRPVQIHPDLIHQQQQQQQQDGVSSLLPDLSAGFRAVGESLSAVVRLMQVFPSLEEDKGQSNNGKGTLCKKNSTVNLWDDVQVQLFCLLLDSEISVPWKTLNKVSVPCS